MCPLCCLGRSGRLHPQSDLATQAHPSLAHAGASACASRLHPDSRGSIQPAGRERGLHGPVHRGAQRLPGSFPATASPWRSVLAGVGSGHSAQSRNEQNGLQNIVTDSAQQAAHKSQVKLEASRKPPCSWEWHSGLFVFAILRSRALTCSGSGVPCRSGVSCPARLGVEAAIQRCWCTTLRSCGSGSACWQRTFPTALVHTRRCLSLLLSAGCLC